MKKKERFFLLPAVIFISLLLFSAFARSGENDKLDNMIKRAVNEYQRGNTPNAMDLIYAVLERYPKNARAKDLYEQIKADEAMRLFKAAAIYFKNGERDIAVKEMEKGRGLSMDVFSKFVQSKILQAKASLANQNVVKCSGLVSEALFFDPGNSEALRIQALLKSSFFREIYRNIQEEKARLSMKRLAEARKLVDNPVKALALANEAVKLDPGNRDAAAYRKRLLKQVATIKESALEKTDKQLARDRAKSQKYFIKAREYYRKKKFDKCFKYLRKAAALNPEAKEAKKMRSEVGAMLCDRELALAVELYSSGKKKAAKKHIQKARNYDPQKVLAEAKKFADKGAQMLKNGDKKQALVLMDRARMLDPEYGTDKALSAAAGAELDGIWEIYRSADYKKAIKELEPVEKKYPGSQDVIFLKNLIQAQISLDDGDFVATREHLLVAIRINPLHKEVWDFFNRLDELLDILGYKFKKTPAAPAENTK